MKVDLRSDTLTQPDAGMREAMLRAPLGDDVFGEDPTVIKLETTLATLFGFEAGLFCPSGTMANQIAIKTHTQPLDEIICDKLSHIYNYETGGWAFHSGVSVRLTEGARGKMSVEQVEELLLPDYDWYPNTRLVTIENTVNKGGGSVYTLDEMRALSDFCKAKGLAFHLDGARIFNALTALGHGPDALHGLFHSASVCLSKGLGAPVGSVLLGGAAFIKRARKIRKAMGGGMRQSGILAAAGLYALENNVKRLADDHRRAKRIAETLRRCPWVKEVMPTETNIVIFTVQDAQETTARLAGAGILVSPFSPIHIRMVTYLHITDDMVGYVTEKLQELYPA
ncbi:MAG: aminotransferase class I/II-fold pyridoxal phosphate-dependent enzyme [Chitinophagales bacterium]|nr:aminotransferase class I/II-fold pyridoxal phosphate-dependent enzyme [Chitinophagales bacterium]MDW8419290.1 GntG family PLP-dependent aldolase [Chitinophagales bacterium]